MFDVARLLAAVSIVWLHTPRSHELLHSGAIGRFAVPFFVCATIFFIWQQVLSKPQLTFTPYCESRFKRLYVPFLAWSVVYLAFKAVKHAALPDQPNDFPGVEFLWAGSFYHLWFMPFILVVSLGVFLLGKNVRDSAVAQWSVAIIGAALGVCLAIAPVPAEIIDTKAELVWNASPAICWGLAVSVLYHRGAARWLNTTGGAIVGLALLGAGTAWIWQGGRDNLAENIAGVGALLIALAPWVTPALTWLARLGPSAYGIYLSHMLFIKSGEAIFNKLGIPATWQVDVTIFVLAVLGSAGLSWLLARSRYTSWLVG